MTPLQTQQSLELVFDSTSYPDLNTEMLELTNLDDSIAIDARQMYPGFDFR